MHQAALVGATLAAIGSEHGITKQAVSFVLKTKFGCSALELRRAAAREREEDKQSARAEVLRRRLQAANAVEKLTAKGMSFSRAFQQVSASMGPVASHFTIRALTTSVARYGRFQKDLPERRARAIELVTKGASYAQAAAEVRLNARTVARLWREWRALRGLSGRRHKPG